MDTYLCQCTVVEVSVFSIQRNAWSSVVHAMRQLRSLLAGHDPLRAVFLPVVVRPQVLVIMAEKDQKERYVAPCRKLRIFRSCSSSLVVDFSCRGAEADSHGLDLFSRTIETPQLLLSTLIDVPVAQVVQGRRFFAVVQRPVPMVQPVRWTRCSMSLLLWVVQFVYFPVVAQRAAVARGYGGRCPCCAGRVPARCWARHMPTVQTMQTFVEVPQSQFLHGYGRLCDHAATLGSQVLFLDKVDDTRCCSTTGAWD